MLTSTSPEYISILPADTNSDSGKWLASLSGGYFAVASLSSALTKIDVSIPEINGLGGIDLTANNSLFLDLNYLPLLVSNTWVEFSTGWNFCAAIDTFGYLWTWGQNNSGQLGIGSLVNKNIPVQVGLSSNWVKVVCGAYHTLAVNSLGELWTWGLNSRGQLGDGSVTRRTLPVHVGSDTDWAFLGEVHGEHSVALKSDGTLWTWGRNSEGQLGNGTENDTDTPAQIGSLVWDSLAGGASHTIGIRTVGLDITIWTWGSNNSGQLGIGSTTNQKIPTQVGSDTDWSSVSCGASHTQAIKDTGALWSWGNNNSGQLGDGTQTQRIAPVETDPGSLWATSYAGVSHSIGIKPDGSMWLWGLNQAGQLGIGTSYFVSSPSKLDNNTDWVKSAAGQWHTGAINSSGQLLLWGNNSLGQLGQGYTFSKAAEDEHLSLTYSSTDNKLVSSHGPFVLSYLVTDDTLSIDTRFRFSSSLGVPAGYESAQLYLPSTNVTLFAVESPTGVALQTIDTSAPGIITESALSADLMPIGTSIEASTKGLSALVSLTDDSIVCIRTDDGAFNTTLVLYHVSSTLAIVDTHDALFDAIPVALTGLPEYDRFVLRYLDPLSLNVYFIVGKTLGVSGIELGTPLLYNSGVLGHPNKILESGVQLPGTHTILSSLSSATNTKVLLSEVDLVTLSLTHDIAGGNDIPSVPKYSVPATYNAGSGKVVVGLFGDGDGAGDTPLADKAYASLSFIEGIQFLLASSLALELTVGESATLDINLEIASALSLELTADQGLDSCVLRIREDVALRFEADEIHTSLLIGDTLALELQASFPMTSELRLASDLALELTGSMSFAAQLAIGSSLSLKLLSNFAPTAQLKIADNLALELQVIILKGLELRMASGLALELTAECDSQCGACAVGTYNNSRSY